MKKASRRSLLVAALAPVTGILLFLLAQQGDVRAQLQVPPHLDILSATLAEALPTDPGNAADRAVSFVVEVGGTPPCLNSSTPLSYGFLLDTDHDPTTGVTNAAFSELGVDARIVAECNSSTGNFTSLAGTVDVTTDPATGATTVAITTKVGKLPSLDFDWIAFAFEGTRFLRLPETGFGAWTTFERTVR
ncbi:MAG: hypothetical protein ACRDKB_08200 [Actinomycetota bacterium]